MAVLLHAVPLAGVCRKERSSPVPQVRARPEEMRCVGSKRTRELGRDMLLAASIVKSSVAKAHGRNRTVSAENVGLFSINYFRKKKTFSFCRVERRC